MKVIKLDRRYAGFPKWKYACQFPVRNHNYRKEYFNYVRTFKELFGAESQSNPDRNTGDWSKPFWIYNEHWCTDFPKQRILVKDQAVISMIMLKMPG